MSAESTGTKATRAAAAARLTPGAVLGPGRYRLVNEVGRDDRCAAQLWRGLDTVLERDVALTLFIAEPGNTVAVTEIRTAVQQALSTARLDTPGAARVLDILEPEPVNAGPPVAAVVAEWTEGRDLVEYIQAGLPEPSVAASMLAPLARAVDDAHRAGLVLGSDHPQRIRITAESRARLAFPGPPVGTQAHDDIRGLGAVLYLVLTGHWALDDGPPALPAAPRGPEGNVVSPRSLRPTVPLELSTLAVRSLAGSSAGGVHTGAAVLRVLERSMTIGQAEVQSTNGAADRKPVWHAPEEDPPPSREHRTKLGIGVAALVVATLLIIGWVGGQVASVFSEDETTPPAVVINDPQSANGVPPAPPPAGPVEIKDVAVYDAQGDGDPDNPEDVDLLVDGDPDTSWSTDNYFQQFPAYKPGVGVLVTLTESVTLSSVSLVSPSAGTVVQIRSAPSANPDFDETTVIGTATLNEGRTQIPLQAAPPTRYLIVWITRLAGAGGDNISKLSELDVQRAR
ncbi:MAG: protein kinase family protein [Actinomycetota bacterium]|nr:protein kinase family protein [Actinomycetota bacterium]